MRKLLLAATAIVAVTGCSSTGTLTPTQQTIASVACQVDNVVQPIALPFVSGIPTVGGLAATADAAIAHPLVVKACNDLAASMGTGSAKPVVVPAGTVVPGAAPTPAAVPTS